MKTNVRRLLCLVLALVLCFGLIPGVFAAEVDTPGTDIPTDVTEETAPPTTEDTTPTEEPAQEKPPAEDSPPEESVPDAESTEPSTEPSAEDVTQDGPGIMEAMPNGTSTWAIGSTQKSIMLFDYADNGNYTTVLNSQVACAYKPNGSGTTRTAYIKNLGWHFARYGGVPYPDDPLYCIEPWRSYAASTSGNSVDREVTLDGSGSTSGSNVWYALPAARREAIGLILLYSNQMWNHSISVTTTSKANNPNVPLRIATQFLIYEIVCGLRDPITFTLNSTNECGTAGNIFYNAGAASVTNFTSNYNTLVSNIQAAKKIPSFTSASSSSAPTISLTGEETSVYDSNGVLSNFSFTDGNGAEFYKSGSTLYITQTGSISSSTVYKATRYLPSAASSTYNLWYMSGSSYQTTVSLASASSGNLNAYFKLKAPDPGAISLTKTTEDGQNLSGWRFGMYTNSACTSLAAGPYTTNSSGKISITGLTAGTYYVKELGHTDSSINALYTCSSTNPQKVSVTSGGTTSVSFYNKLNTGSISLTKTTEDGQNLSGWQFGIYSNSACTTLVSGPHSTNTSGKISVTGLTPGTYYVKEIGHTDSSINALYYCSSTNPQAVTVTAGATVSVSFTNKLNTGGVKLIKSTNTGANLSGWQIGLYTDADCTNAVSGSPFTTGADGTVTVTALLPGTYYAKEIPTDDPYWEFDAAVKSVTVAVGQTAEVTFTNTHYGRIAFRKTTNTGNQLGGWTFRVKDSNGNTVGDFTTDDNGYACTQNLPLGRYAKKVREAEKTTSTAKGVAARTKEAAQAAASFARNHSRAILPVLGIGMILVMLIGGVSSCSMMAGSGVSSVLGTSYLSEDRDILAAEAAYCAMEAELQAYLDTYRSTHSYDEYHFTLDTIEHDPYVLISILSALHEGVFTIDEVQNDLEMLFGKQYILTETVETETRYQTETIIDERPKRDPLTGEILYDRYGYPIMEEYEYEEVVPYTYYICTVELENFNLSHVPVYIMGEETLSMYATYMGTLGNREDLFPDSPYVPKYTTKPPTYEVSVEALADETFAALITEAEKYIGYPYVWGGSNPSTSFDCSGFVSWALTNSGVCNVGRLSAQGLYNISTPVPTSNAQPGDLIFFKGTYDTPGISHVGIYAGGGMMLHCGDPIRYVTINTSYWQSHFYTFARPPYNH